MLKSLLIFIMVQTCYAQKINCVQHERPISNNTFYLVDVHYNEEITLQCHFCDEVDDGQQKHWFKATSLQKESTEINSSMENNIELQRIIVHSDHSLIIRNFSFNDSGLYYCKTFEESDTEFRYFVDVVDEVSTDVESGNLSDWKQYYEELFAPVNKILVESDGPEFIRLRNELKVSMEVVSNWGRWSKCLCDKPGDLSNRTKVIPDFIHLENCQETCNPDKDSSNVGWKVGKSKDFKYRKTFVLLEKSYLSLVCPESTLDNKILWKKRGKTIKAGDTSYPHMYVDSFNTLYLVNVTSVEEGNYSCQVDDIQMQRIIIHITSKSKFISGELTRHLGYLGFVLLLTVPCYCAGLIVTWWRRDTFETYEDYMKEKKEVPYQINESTTLL